MKTSATAVILFALVLSVITSDAAGPPWPQPLHNVRAVRVAGIKTQVEADRVMAALRTLRSVWLVTDLTPERGFVRVGWGRANLGKVVPGG
jgi:hypothetical protein